MPNKATIALLYRIPGASRWTRGFEAGGIITAESGQPFTATLSPDNGNSMGVVARPSVLFRCRSFSCFGWHIDGSI
jgi:hypothetical protein